jgi:transposase
MLSLSAGNKNDASEGRELLETVGPLPGGCETVKLLMDKGYEDNKTRKIGRNLGYEVVVPPKITRKDSWDYDKAAYKVRNIEERFFNRLKRFRRVFIRYDKLDRIYVAFIILAVLSFLPHA